MFLNLEWPATVCLFARVRVGAAYPSRTGTGNRASLLLLLAAPASGQYVGGGPQRAPTFDTAGDPQYGDPRDGLRAVMRSYRTHRRGPQHFCVVGYRYSDGGRNAYIVWREGRRQILWEGWSDPLDRIDSIRLSRRNLDMDTDVVPDGTFNSSVYLIFRHERRAVEADCAANGRRYVLPYPKAAAAKPPFGCLPRQALRTGFVGRRCTPPAGPA
jgi:hypothetical protein